MINALFLDPRIWKIDYLTSPYWNPEKFGVKFDLHPSAFNIPKTGVDKKYKVVVATEMWEKPMQATLEYLRNRGLKIVLIPREISPAPIHLKLMYDDPQFEYKGKCYTEPDVILSPGLKYSELWNNRCKIIKEVGYPRFDVCVDKAKWKTKDQVLKRHGIELNKKLIFFPSFPPYHIQLNEKGENYFHELQDDLQNILKTLEAYAIRNQATTQVIVKIHPTAQKCYDKGIGLPNMVHGLLKKYYKQPTSYMKVIGDIRTDSSVSHELLQISDLVVGYTSMMMLESIILNKPILHVQFSQCKSMKGVMDFSTELETLYTPEKLALALENIPEKNNMDANQSKLIKDYLYKVDGKFCERVCAEIKNIVG